MTIVNPEATAYAESRLHIACNCVCKGDVAKHTSRRKTTTQVSG